MSFLTKKTGHKTGQKSVYNYVNDERAKTAWQSQTEQDNHRAGCPRCGLKMEVKGYIDLFFQLLTNDLECGKNILLPGIGTFVIREVPARELEDTFFHKRSRPLKTVVFKPNRNIVKRLNNLK